VENKTSIRTRVPRQLYEQLVNASDQKIGSLLTQILNEYLTDPQKIADQEFIHFAEVGNWNKNEFKYVKVFTSPENAAIFKSLANVLHVNHQDLFANALVHYLKFRKKFNLNKIFYTSISKPLLYDEIELAKLIENKKPVSQENQTIFESEKSIIAAVPSTTLASEPLVTPATYQDWEALVRTAGKRSPLIRKAREEERSSAERLDPKIWGRE
jgi:hypothetical protein